MNLSKFEAASIVIAGGGSGMGRSIALQLAPVANRIVLLDRNARAGAKVQRELQDRGCESEFIQTEMTDFASVEAALTTCTATGARIDYFFNCVGIVHGGEISDTPFSDALDVFDTNLHSLLTGTHLVYRYMIAQGSGHIINFGSVAGLLPTPAMAFYTATKFAIVGFSQALRAEARAHNVRVSVVCPGFVKTPIYETAFYSGLKKRKVLKLLFDKVPIQTADQAASRILRGVSKNRMIIHTWYSLHALWLVYRISPALYGLLAGWSIGPIRTQLEQDR